MDTFLGMDRTAQIAAASLLAFTPIFFAGVMFAVSFTRAVEPDRAFGANIAGAMFGGLAEYSSMLLGFQYLLFVAVALYVISIIGYQKAVTGTPAAHIGQDAGRIVRRRLVFDQRDVRHIEADARFAAIDDLHRADHGAAGGGHEVRASLERRSRVPHIVHDQHALALHARRVERAQRRPPFVIAKRRKRIRRMRHRPAAVEQARHRVRQQRAAGGRAGDDLRACSMKSAGMHVDQILRHAPDRRRILKQLVRIQVQLAVKAVAVIEVAFHHHFEPAQIFERARANFVVTSVACCVIAIVTRRAETRFAGLTYTTLPPTIVAATPPLNDQP